MTDKTIRLICIILLFTVGLNALAGGYSFIMEPSGKDIGITTEYLEASAPFKDFRIPGILLFLVNGVLSFFVACLVLKRRSRYQWAVIMQGSIFLAWIIIQLTMVTTFHILHAIIASVGIALIVFGWILNRDEMRFGNS